MRSTVKRTAGPHAASIAVRSKCSRFARIDRTEESVSCCHVNCDRATGVVVISENPLRLKSEPRSCGKGSRRDSRCLQLRRALDLLASVPPSFPARLSFSQSRRCRGEAVSGPVPVFLFEPLFHLPIGKNRGSIPDAPLAAQKPRQLLGELVSADRSAVSFPSAPRALSACRPPPPNWDDAESPDPSAA
jgi:hypothetical protein